MLTDPDVLDRIDALAQRAREERESFEPPEDPPDEARATEYVRDGLGPTISAFVEFRTGGRMEYFPPETYDRLQEATNHWLAMYAACYGVDVDGEYQLREAAELLVDTRDAGDVAQILTGVPERR
ncbi:hypothetical protein [Halomicrobium salinisoli]|uniref:hypothetical protein n=1 Tax=Halomicrobium salinisoli TaxID=2878391 RepID=UPI001CEFB737|nr:hypothetical protein [Halomicrobium salinisoli]